MSIVVTCACTMEYRLPDRYAGKRCRCRECGGRIRVPREGRSSSSELRKKRRKRARAESPERKRRKKKKTATTTRRMGAQDRDILSARRALRSSSQKPVSESMHQLAPLRSGDRLERHVGLSRKAGKRARAKSRERQAERARRKRERRRESDERPVKKARKARKRETPGSEETQAIRSRKPRTPEKGKTKAPKAPERKKRGTSTGKVKTAKGKAPQRSKGKGRTTERKRRPARKTRPYGRRSGEDEDEGGRGRKKKTSPTRAALYAVIVIAGVLCLGIGLVVGTTLFMANEVVNSEVSKKLERIDELKDARQWEFAQKEADELEVLLKAVEDEDGLKKLYATRAGIDKMVEITKIEDDMSRLDNLLSFARDDDPAVRHGIVWELRKIAAGVEEAQQGLAALAKDSDKKVAEAAKQALVQSGGRHSVPYLVEAIERSAATGGKQGEVAIERALEIDDPSVGPVLVKILELRPKAPAGMLRQVLERLGEYGTAEAVPVVERFTKHEDPEVAEIAQAVVEELKG